MFMIRAAAVFGIVSICSVLAHGQWSPDPNLNLPVAVKTDVQVQPKVVSTVDGGCYVSWYDNDPTGDPPGGYDVFLQRFDAQGVPQWALDGIRLADLGLDYTTDYGLSVDASGNALLTFLDDRFGEYKQITAIKVDPTGAQVWGPNGIQLTNDATDKGNPKITPTSDGAIVVAWNSGKDIKLQRLDSSGGPQWIPPVTLTRMATMTYQLGDLHASNDGSVIISWVRFKSLVTAFHLWPTSSLRQVYPNGASATWFFTTWTRSAR